jgi:nucleoside-diphosphate-sugar epimerase
MAYRSRLRCDVVLNNLVSWAHATGAIRLKSDGTPWRPLIHVRDIARAFLLAMTAPREVIGGRAFNVVGAAENYQIRDLAQVVAETIQGCRVELALDASPDARNYRVRGDRFAEAVGFEAEWDARSGAAELAAAFRMTGLTIDEAEGPRYQRIARIRQRLAEGSLDRGLRASLATS